MLDREIKNKYITLIVSFVCVINFLSCNNETQKLKEREELYKSKSLATVSKIVYDSVYEIAEDTLKNWCANRLPAYVELWASRYKMDSLLCFNNTRDKFVTALLLPCMQSDCSQDDIRFFYGVKIKETWYFFDGATVVLPREMYEKDISKPLSFEKLHEIAMKEVFSGYLIKDEKGNWVINDKFFDELNSILDFNKKDFKTESEWEDWFTKTIVKNNWNRK